MAVVWYSTTEDRSVCSARFHTGSSESAQDTVGKDNATRAT